MEISMNTATRVTISVGLAIILGAVQGFMYYLQSALVQAQAIQQASSLNDDSVAGNAYTAWYTHTTLSGAIFLTLFVIVMALIWGPVLNGQTD